MYTGYELTKEARDKIKALFPPSYPDFIGHHITEKFGVPPSHPAPEQPTRVRVVGYANDEGRVEGFLVEVDGTTERVSGGRYHITWSIDRSKGVKPAHTNLILDRVEMISPIEIDVVAKTFKY